MSQQKEAISGSLVKWIILIGLASSTVILGLFVLLYAQTGEQHMLVIAGLAASCVACLAVAAWLVRRGNVDVAGYWVLGGVLVGYGGSELVAAGATLHLAVGGSLLLLVLSSVVLPGRRRAWLAIVSLFAAYVWLVNRFKPLPRYDLAQSAILRLYIIPATTALVALMVVWRLLRAHHRIETIGSRLVIDFVLLVLLPVGTISALSGVLGWQNGRQQVINQLESVVTLKEAEINTWVNSLQTYLSLALHEHQSSSLEVLLQEPAATRADYQAAYDELEEHFTLMMEEVQLFDEVFLMDLQGHVVLSTDGAQEGKIRSNQTYFWDGLEGAGIHPPSYSPSLGRISTVAVRPVVDGQGSTLGVLAGRASMAKLSEIMLERAGLGETGETYLVGSNHAMLTGSRLVVAEEEVGTYVRSEGANVALEDRVNGSGLYDDYRGVPVVGVYHWLPELQVALLAEQDQSEAFRPVYTILGINAGVAAIALLGAIVGALLVARGIAAPLTNLAATATRIAAGDLSVRAPPGRDDEVGQLAVSFNQMVDSIQQAQAELRDSEARFRSLIHTAPAVILSLSPEGHILEFNPAAEQLYGRKRGEVLGQNYLESFLSEEAREGLAEDIRKIVAGEPTRAYENPIVAADGSEYVLTWNVGRLPGAEDQPIGIIAVGQDITERRQAEEALRRSEERYRTLFETMVEGVVYQDADGRIISANPAAERLLGLSLDQMQGRTSTDPRWHAIHEDGSEFPGETHPSMVALRTGEEVRDVIMGVFNPRIEAYAWIRIDAVPLFRPGERKPYQVYTTFTDFTARRRAQVALLAERDRAQRFLDIAGVMIVALNARGEVTLINRKGCEIVGYDEEDLIGRNWFDTCLPARMRREVKTVFERLMRGDVEPVERYSNPITRSSGEERIIAWHNALVRDEDGEVVGTLSSGTDITERVRAQEALQKAHDRLEEQVEERTAELQRFVNLMAGREVRMTELKGVIRQLRAQLEEAGLTPAADDPLRIAD